MNRRDVLKGGLCGALALLANPFRAFGGIKPLDSAPETGMPRMLKFVANQFAPRLMMDFTSSVNADFFFGNPPGTVRFLGSHWTRRDDGKWDVTLEFDYSADHGRPRFNDYFMRGQSGEFIRIPAYREKRFKPLMKIGKRVT